MDTVYDFIQPEFLDIIFFRQRNVVIFPYIDLKHLHSLQIFATGYDKIDIDATALHNLQEIIDYEKSSSYSQQPTFYILYNVNVANLKKLLNSNNIRFIVNTNEKVESLANDSNVVFYNKKNKLFLNYNPVNLEFENYLIKSSSNETILLEKIQQIKLIATKLYTELNEKGQVKNIGLILKDYHKDYWNKILQFTEKYYNIEIPKIKIPYSGQKRDDKKPLKDFSAEYDLIIKSNRNIAQEFVQLIHEYRIKKVNPANLEIEQLYYPKKLYNYLRNHHWEKGISMDFIEEWINMAHTDYFLTEDDIADFKLLLQKLNISSFNISSFRSKPYLEEPQSIVNKSIKKSDNLIPSIKNFQEFKIWILKKLEEVEKLNS